MPRIGITGHLNLTADGAALVQAALAAELSQYRGGIVGVTCLARGADQLFARAVLDAGGTFEVVLPAADYREHEVRANNAAQFDELIGKASKVHTMPFEKSTPDAYLGAGEHVLGIVDELIAVWDGQPAAGRGGTGDVVRVARERGIPVTVVWPDGTSRG
ncbi:hypothetical protein SAMN05421805_106159 [Saccharopolyspora antimicrobica]|uniref:DNA recombination-mediator protein A n=1 Tax=Saccharopolyspora antimicrobica TaxID=455193 RepID=A0A1I5B985_9PSEU|nr:hypothetical protein [Saccharopolyspora antimicrobica]RKT86506.1 hypothetical protein ATL45_4884 [Saccharopolyspora antimicrobica]SFN71069.1 hypothetical protein SAMN05421805_106159 [Saccharopolyspora antimicrobica]